jgi:hypothetical protein
MLQPDDPRLTKVTTEGEGELMHVWVPKTVPIVVRLRPDARRPEDGEPGEVAGEVREPFAVHRTCLGSGTASKTEWTLTHLPTGMAVSKILPSNAAAKALADGLETLAIDWPTIDFDGVVALPPEVKRQVRKAVWDARFPG